MKRPTTIGPGPLLDRWTLATVLAIAGAALLLGAVLPRGPHRQCVLWSETPATAARR